MRAGVDVDMQKVRFVDVQNIFHKMEQRTLVAAYKFYCGRDLTEAHSAEADTLATYEVLKAQLDRYPETLQNDVDFLADFSSREHAVDFADASCITTRAKRFSTSGSIKGKPFGRSSEPNPATIRG